MISLIGFKSHRLRTESAGQRAFSISEMCVLPTCSQISPTIPPSQDHRGPCSALSDAVEVTESQGARSVAVDVRCCCVLGSFSRRIVGWSIDTVQDANLVVNALDMAIKNRRPEPGGIVHADHGTQFTSWAFTNKIRSSGMMPSFVRSVTDSTTR